MPDTGTDPVPGVLRTLPDLVRPAWTAVLVIDMLNDFLSEDGKTARRAGRSMHAARKVIPRQQRLLDAARARGATVVYVKHLTLPGGRSSSGPWIEARTRATYSVDDICLQGTWGAEVIDELTPRDDLEVCKHRYSGFAGTGLDLLLRTHGIRTVLCAGVSTNVCVEATAREAFSLDYYVVFAEDACASWDASLHEATLTTARQRYANVVDVETVVDAWTVVDDGQDEPSQVSDTLPEGN